MGKITQNWDLGMLLVRLGVGGVALWYGGHHLMAGPSRWARLGKALYHLGIDFYPEMWGLLAAVIGLVGGICLIFGVFFRPACLLLVVIMAIAVHMYIAGGNGPRGAILALENGFILLGLAITGPGRYGLGR